MIRLRIEVPNFNWAFLEKYFSLLLLEFFPDVLDKVLLEEWGASCLLPQSAVRTVRLVKVSFDHIQLLMNISLVVSFIKKLKELIRVKLNHVKRALHYLILLVLQRYHK